MPNFNQRVYEIVKKVPKGKVTTYGDIAMALGNPRLTRQVGWALHANNSADIPCHRVVNKEGRLAPNFAFDGWQEQKKRLMAEGVTFKDETHVDLIKLRHEIDSYDDDRGFTALIWLLDLIGNT